MVYFDFINKNFYSIDKIKGIKYINISDLNFSNVKVTRNKNLNWGDDFKNVYFTIKERKNNYSIIKSVSIPKYEYNQKSKFMFQIIKRISKNGKNNPQAG